MNLSPHTHLHICQGISSFHAAEVLQTCLLMMNRRWPCGKNNGREIFMISVLFNPMVKSGMPDLYINDFFFYARASNWIWCYPDFRDLGAVQSNGEIWNASKHSLASCPTTLPASSVAIFGKTKKTNNICV